MADSVQPIRLQNLYEWNSTMFILRNALSGGCIFTDDKKKVFIGSNLFACSVASAIAMYRSVLR